MAPTITSCLLVLFVVHVSAHRDQFGHKSRENSFEGRDLYRHLSFGDRLRLHRRQNDVPTTPPTTEPPTEEPRMCYVASDVLGSLVADVQDLADKLVSFGPLSERAILYRALRQMVTVDDKEEGLPSVQQLLLGLTGWDLFDQDERDVLICTFEDVRGLSSLLTALDATDLVFHLTKAAYDVGVYLIHDEKARLLETLKKPQANVNQKKFASIKLELMDHIEAAGLLDMDPYGVAIVEKINSIFDSNGDVQQVPEVPLSTLPLREQCINIATAVRKVWYAIKAKQNDTEAVQDTRDVIRKWTGIEWSGHGDILGMICELLGMAIEDGIEGVYTWLSERRVYDHVLSEGYPYVVWMVKDLQHTFSITLSKPWAAGDKSADIYRSLDQLLYLLGDMGLYDLENDFAFDIYNIYK